MLDEYTKKSKLWNDLKSYLKNFILNIYQYDLGKESLKDFILS